MSTTSTNVPAIPTGAYAIDPIHSRIGFVARHAMVTRVRGTFNDMETYPEIAFASTAVEQVDAENYRVTGDLTIKGVTKPVTIDFEYTGMAVDLDGNQRIGLEGTATVNRKDWGVNWNAALEAGGILVSEKVTLEFDVSAIRTNPS